MEDLMEVEDDDVRDVSSHLKALKSRIVANWLHKLDEGTLSHVHFRDHWKTWVPKAYTMERNPSCLDWGIKEQIVQQVLINTLEEFMCRGDKCMVLSYLGASDNTPSVCGKVFKLGEPTYNCRDCGMDPTCVLCLECFKLSEHKNHRYKMGTSSGGGCCDCGDVEAWRTSPYCKTHELGLKRKNRSALPTDFAIRIHWVFTAVLRYAYQILTLEYSPGLPSDLRLKEEDLINPLSSLETEDLFCTVLYNDETHTFEQVINTLARVIKCSQRDAIEFVTNIDREGRAVVNSSTFQHCTELKMDIERFTSRHGTRPLKVLVVHAYVIAHQIFALRLLAWLQKIVGIATSYRNIFADVVLHHKHPDGSSVSLMECILMKDSLLWKSARLHWHRLLISGMFMEYESKKAFAKVFTKNYGAVLKDFIRDDHDHGFSVASLSIQIFPVPTLAQYLIAYEDVLFILLNTFISECSRKCNRVGKLEFDRTAPTGPFKRATYILYDIRYLLGSPPTKWTDELRKGFLQGVSLILTLLTYMQGMDSVTRQIGQHMEYEPEWESAFNLHIKLAPVITMVLKWCSSDRVVLIKAYRLTLKKLFENPSFDPNQPGVVRELADHSVSCLQYDVSTQPVSIHLPLSRFLAGLHLHLEKFGLNFDSSEFYHLSKQTPVQIIEPVLRTQVMIAQVHAGMWRRNGYSLSNQIFFYHNVKCRGEMLDKDVVLLQIGASLIESNEFLIHTLNKYGLIYWASDDFEINSIKNSEEDTMKQTINMVEEFLSLLIVITGERYIPGVGKITQDDCIKNEIMHQLFIHPLSHSEVNKTLPDDMNHETGMERVINEVATYKKQVSGKGVYVIKPEFLEKYNVFFYHYTKEEMSKSEEEQRKLRREKTGLECCPPPVLPSFSEPFNMVADLLQCDVMLHIMKVVLERSLNLRARSFSEAQLHKILHLIGYALHEEEQKYSTFFQFTTRAEKWRLEKILEKLTTSARVEAHRDLLNYTLKKYRQVAYKKNEYAASSSSADTSSEGSHSSDSQEKEYRARLAAEKRAKIMAQIAMQQQLFMKENAALFNETQITDRSDSDKGDVDMTSAEGPVVCLGPHQTLRPAESRKSYMLTCIICQENEVVRHDGPAMVLAAFIQKSTVLCRLRSKSIKRIGINFIKRLFSNDRIEFNYISPFVIDGEIVVDPETFSNLTLDSTLGPAPHASTCGHVMHSTCWSSYIDGILSKENRRPYRLRQPTSFDIEKNEYLCPLCNCLNNTVIPVIPELHTIPDSKSSEPSVEKVSFPSWYEASLVAVKHKRKIDESLRTIGDSDDDDEGQQISEQFVDATSEVESTDRDMEELEPRGFRVEQLSASSSDINFHSANQPVPSPADSSISGSSVSPSGSRPRPVPLNKLVALKEGDIFMKLRIFFGMYDNSENKAPEELATPQSIISPDLLQMIQLFAQMAYTKGLEVNPHEDDPAVPMLAWKCCAYTIRATECLLRYTNKPLLGDFTCRQQDGLENLIKLSGLLGAVWKNKQVANKLGVRLLMMVIDNKREDTSLLDWDCFGLLVPLTGTLPSIFHGDFLTVPSGSILDLHIVTLLLLANIAQAIVISDLSSVTDSDESDEDTACLQNLVTILRSVEKINTVAMWNLIKIACSSFLRSAAIFYHFLTGIPPSQDLRKQGGDTYENICKYLGLPTTCNGLLGISTVPALFKTWSGHPSVAFYYRSRGLLRDMNSLNQLVRLPDDYSELLNTVSLFTCPNSDREDSRNPTMCLICGEMLCSQTYCCQTEINKILVGACTYHSHTCGAGAGIFLRVRECEILLLASPNRGCFLAPPYLDDYGEPDQGLRRGNPLHLSEEKYRRLQLLWLSHSIHEEIARAIETANSLMPTQWQHL